MTNKVIVVVGPTAVGKTKLGVELALKLNGEVISGDSMQIYRQMDIGTAKVSNEETKGIIHHLIDIKDFNESYSVSDFQCEVRKCIQEIHSRHKIPIIVGGTGLYIKAALYDYEFSKEVQKQENQYNHLSNEELYQLLQKIDPATALTLHQNNRRRVIRAIEIFKTSGEKKSEIENKQQHVCLYDVCFIGLTLPRQTLYERINLRVDLMFKQGLLEEFKHLLLLGATFENQSMKAIGYKELFDYQNGIVDLDKTVDLIKQHSRQYAKRQYTWFKNQMDIHWLNVNLEDFNQTVNEALDYIKNQKYFKHLTLKYHDEDVSNLMINGVEHIKIGYSEGVKENPSLYEIKTGQYQNLYLIDFYYNSNIISTDELLEKINSTIDQIEQVGKKNWQQNGYDFEKFYELKEV